MCLEQAAKGIGLYGNLNKTKFKSFKQYGAIYTLDSHLLKLVDYFTNFSSNISLTESIINRGMKMACSLSHKDPWERHEPIFPSATVKKHHYYSFTRILLELNSPQILI